MGCEWEVPPWAPCKAARLAAPLLAIIADSTEPLQHERKVHASSDESAELLGSVVTEPSLVKVEARLR